MKFRFFVAAALMSGLLYSACSTSSDGDDDDAAGGNGGDASAGANGQAGGGGDDAAGGDGGQNNSMGGNGGNSTGGSGGGGMAGGAPTAVAMIQAIEGGTIKGTATFTQSGNDVTVVISLTDCPAGTHGIAIHSGNGCGNRNAQGDHWGPERGEGIGGGSGEIVCGSDMKAMLTYTRPGTNANTKWNIGNPATSDIVGHPIVVHGLQNSDHHGCGVIMKQ